MADRVYFGGKHNPALPWEPLPYQEEYLQNLTVDERNPRYIEQVKLGLARFNIFAATEGIKHPGEIERKHILRYQAYLMDFKKDDGEPFKRSYRQQLMIYLRAWINWMVNLDYISPSPWVLIRVGTTPKVPHPLEEDEVDQLFAAHTSQAFTISPFAFHRRETILTLLYGWGLRIHELQSLTVSQLDMRLDYVTVRNKGGGSKTLPFGTELKAIIQRWLVVRARYAKVGEDSLLIDQSGNELSIPMIRKIIVELGQRANIKINPHMLRDTFGTTMLDNDVPVERIMKLMGHTPRSQTLAYARVNDSKVKESHDAVMNPKLHRLLRPQEPKKED